MNYRVRSLYTINEKIKRDKAQKALLAKKFEVFLWVIVIIGFVAQTINLMNRS